MLAPALLGLVLVLSPADAPGVIEAALEDYVERKCGSRWVSLPTLVSDLAVQPDLGHPGNVPAELARMLERTPPMFLELPPLYFPFRAMNAREQDRLSRPWDADTLDELQSGGGFLRFSVPLVSDDGTTAVIYMAHSCGNLCADGTVLHLEKKPHGWIVVRAVPLWVS